MVICFRCQAETKEALDALMDSGQYKDYAEAISVAIENLAGLHSELSDGGVVILDSSPREHGADRLVVAAAGLHSSQGRLAQHSAAVPTIFTLDGLADSEPQFADPPDDVWSRGQEVPMDRWVFGHYNRLFPGKANCRGLAHLLISQPSGVPIEDAAQKIAQQAALLGVVLKIHDERNGTHRDHALATAFPSRDRDPERSKRRYADHFVGSLNRDDRLSGLLVDYKLVSGRHGSPGLIMLTEAGWRLATMRNPVLDGLHGAPTEKFSEKERQFLLRHIAVSVPAEDFAFRAVLRAIGSGEDGPRRIDAALRKTTPRVKGRQPSKSYLASQRSGAISRMTDVGLVRRIRNGVRVSYRVTKTGEDFLRT